MIDATRAQLVAALEAAGLGVALAGGKWAAPVALVGTDDPWLVPVAIARGYRTVRYAVDLIAGRADQARTWTDLAGMAEAAVNAIDGLPGWSAPTVAAGRSIETAGAVYLIARLSAETQTALAPGG